MINHWNEKLLPNLNVQSNRIKFNYKKKNFSISSLHAFFINSKLLYMLTNKNVK